MTDFEPVALVVEQAFLLVTRNDLPASNLPEFIAYAKANQAKMQFGSAGVSDGGRPGVERAMATFLATFAIFSLFSERIFSWLRSTFTSFGLFVFTIFATLGLPARFLQGNFKVCTPPQGTSALLYQNKSSGRGIFDLNQCRSERYTRKFNVYAIP